MRSGARGDFEGGGEPLINKHTLEALRLANDLGIKTAMSTNGRLLTPEIAASVDYLRVSLNAGTAAYNMVYRRHDGTIGWVEPRG